MSRLIIVFWYVKETLREFESKKEEVDKLKAEVVQLLGAGNRAAVDKYIGPLLDRSREVYAHVASLLQTRNDVYKICLQYHEMQEALTSDIENLSLSIDTIHSSVDTALDEKAEKLRVNFILFYTAEEVFFV